MTLESDSWIASPIFRFLVFPAISTFIAAFVRYSTRPDRYLRFRKEDISVGLNLSVTACLMYAVLISERARQLVETYDSINIEILSQPPNQATISKLLSLATMLSRVQANAPFTLLVMVGCLLLAAFFVRKYGWLSKHELDPFVGIGMPLAVGTALLTFVAISAS